MAKTHEKTNKEFIAMVTRDKGKLVSLEEACTIMLSGFARFSSLFEESGEEIRELHQAVAGLQANGLLDHKPTIRIYLPDSEAVSLRTLSLWKRVCNRVAGVFGYTPFNKYPSPRRIVYDTTRFSYYTSLAENIGDSLEELFELNLCGEDANEIDSLEYHVNTINGIGEDWYELFIESDDYDDAMLTMPL